MCCKAITSNWRIIRAIVSVTAAFFNLDSPKASRLNDAMRTVGNEWVLPERGIWLLLETVGHLGARLVPDPALCDGSGAMLSVRKCSPSEEFDTSRLDELSRVDPRGRVVFSVSRFGFGELLDSAASLVCNPCHTATVESWKAIAKPPRMPAITTWLFLSDSMVDELSAKRREILSQLNEKTFADFASEGLFRFGLKDLWWFRPIPFWPRSAFEVFQPRDVRQMVS